MCKIRCPLCRKRRKKDCVEFRSALTLDMDHVATKSGSLGYTNGVSYSNRDSVLIVAGGGGGGAIDNGTIHKGGDGGGERGGDGSGGALGGRQISTGSSWNSR